MNTKQLVLALSRLESVEAKCQMVETFVRENYVSRDVAQDAMSCWAEDRLAAALGNSHPHALRSGCLAAAERELVPVSNQVSATPVVESKPMESVTQEAATKRESYRLSGNSLADVGRLLTNYAIAGGTGDAGMIDDARNDVIELIERIVNADRLGAKP